MNKIQYIVIGGSAGSFNVVTDLLSELPKDYQIPIILVLHRLKHIKSGFVEALSTKSAVTVREPFDKEEIVKNMVYIAPANYHLCIEANATFSLSVEEQVNHSRPSIDISLSTAGRSLKNKILGIVLSGANKDGAVGLNHIKEAGGYTIVQSPEDATVKTMPDAAIAETNPEKILSSQEIIDFILNLNIKE